MKNRRASLVLVPAVLAAMTLSACQDEAPTAAPPTAASQPPSPSQQPQQPAPTSQAPAPAPSSQAPAPAPSSSAAPAPSSGGAGQCEESSSYTLERGSVQPKPVGTAQRITTDNGSEVEVTVGKPTIDTSSGDTFFPGDGMQAVIYPITVKLISGSFYVTTYLAFGVADAADNACARDYGTVVKRSERMPVETLRAGDVKSAKAAYAVPAGTDMSKIYVLFADNYDAGKAELAWNGS